MKGGGVEGDLEEKEGVDCKRTVTPEDASAFDLDHLPEFEKVEAVSEMVNDSTNYTFGQIEFDLTKCDLRCANCHRVETVERRTAVKYLFRRRQRLTHNKLHICEA